MSRGLPLLAIALMAGCGGSSGTEPDAATRADASIVETGLAFDDAQGDAATYEDASHARDGGVALCRGSCDPVRASGCGTGEVCVLRGELASCGPPGAGARGASCASTAECANGLACFAAPTAGAGICDRICCPGADDCGTGELCGGDGLLVDGTATSWGRCAAPRTCALLVPTECPDREGCYVVDAMGHTQCLLAGASLEGEACTAPNDCAPDLVCTGALERTCARLCQLGLADDPCGAGAMCVRQAYTPDGVGVCVAAAARMP